ncbi:phosphoglyceromutase [Helicobacter fennelliae]|uniref:Phosphoglyceromutase n=1 Tax=Helicobacter fennelliae TaxID=215 RepID=A0A2X3EIX8_9HELI|nr:phosphoglyceromutase [Helicobacter fennelliae]
MSQKCVLVITDGIGFKPDSPYNAFFNAKSLLMIGYLSIFHIVLSIPMERAWGFLAGKWELLKSGI